MPDLRVSKQKLAFAAFKKTSAKFNKGTANLQNIPVSKASYLKRDLRSYEKPWQTWWDLSAQLQGDILDCTVLQSFCDWEGFPKACCPGTFWAIFSDVQTSAFLSIR